MKTKPNITTLAELTDKFIGKKGTSKRSLFDAKIKRDIEEIKAKLDALDKLHKRKTKIKKAK